MTERKHTPGPWTRNGNDILVGANGEPIVLAGSRLALGADRGDGERTANNALVESAPQLLADLDTARSEVARLTAEVERLYREVGGLNDSVGVVDTCQIKPLIDGLTAERDAFKAEVEAMRAVVEAVNAAQDEADKGTGNGFGHYCDAVEKARALRARKVGG